MDRVDRDATVQQFADLLDPIGGRDRCLSEQFVVGQVVEMRAAGSQPSPRRPCSSDRNAFCRLSGKVRPIAMTSPTDCICVPSTPVVPGSFSNAQRGNLGDDVVDHRLEARRRRSLGVRVMSLGISSSV